MRQVDNEVRLVKIKPTTIFHGIQEGQVLVSVNGTPVNDVEKAFELLKATELSIIVRDSDSPLEPEPEQEGQSFTAIKANPDDKVGFTMRQVGDEVRIIKVNEDGLFSKIPEGQVLISVNGTPVTSVRQTFELLKTTELTLVVKDAKPLPGEVVKLVIEIMSCRNLLSADKNGLSDPYIKAILGSTEVHKTKHILKT